MISINLDAKVAVIKEGLLRPVFLGITVVHKVRIYKEYMQCMSPRRNWDSPNPSLASECAPPPPEPGVGGHSPAGEGLEESQFRRLEKKLSTLPTLGL